MHLSQTLSPRLSAPALLALTLLSVPAARAATSFLAPLSTITTLSSTVPPNGDVNPYGVARVPVTTGKLNQGSFLVSNFNNSANLQGTGTTIVQIAPDGSFSQFARIHANQVSCPGGIGLTTALVALRSGFVVVGSLPTTDGTSATAQAGCLIVLDSKGRVVTTFSGGDINGPWDMTAADFGDTAYLFVTNVLNGTVAANGSNVNQGTVVRVKLDLEGGTPELENSTVIASGLPERTDSAALVIGPTGVAFDRNSGTLYIADSLDNRIAAVSSALTRSTSAGTGTTVFSGGSLNDPLGLTLTPNRTLVAANGDDGNLVEIDPSTSTQLAAKLVDNTGTPPGSGALFGLIATDAGVYFVDDVSNTFNLLH